MTQDPDKKIKVELEQEQKVIRLGAYFYDLKGVLICEASEEEKKKYYCGKFVTYPIVDDDWWVREDDCIADGISLLLAGKKGDTVPLNCYALRQALDYNAIENECDYFDVLKSLERHGITISERQEDSGKELPNVVALSLEKFGDIYRIYGNWDGYHIPMRFFYVGEDDELFVATGDACAGFKRTDWNVVNEIARDIHSLSYFFNKPSLRVFVTTTVPSKGLQYEQLAEVPKDWYYTIQTLENDINREVAELRKKYPGHYEFKLPTPSLL